MSVTIGEITNDVTIAGPAGPSATAGPADRRAAPPSWVDLDRLRAENAALRRAKERTAVESRYPTGRDGRLHV